jgi:predicted Zn-dependent peptidase
MPLGARHDRRPRRGKAITAAGLKLLPPRPLDPQLFEVREATLPNGLVVRLLPDTAVPAVSLYTFFKVGSRNERPGITGIAHLFEHMMFNGAQKYGPKEFDRVLEGAGGHSNAYTSHDLTAYYEDFAAESLELVLDLESDRMRSLAITPQMLASEREVVKEERRHSVENETLGLLDEELFAIAFAAHPYRWPVIGWMGDIESIGRDDCLSFFRTYYAPNNACLWAVGDFDADRALAAIERHYGDIPRGPPPPAPSRTEPPQRGERRAEVFFPAHASALAIGYKAPAGGSEAAPVLDVIQYALSASEGARLVRSLVYDKLMAANLAVDYAWRADPGLFVLLVELNPGVRPEAALSVLERELARVAEQGLDERELMRAKALLRAQLLREIASNNGRAHALGTHELLTGSWREALELASRYAAVDNAAVKRVARSTFDPSQRSVVTLVPERAKVGRAGVLRRRAHG